MGNIKVVKVLGIYFIILGIIMFFALVGDPDPEAAGACGLALILIAAPGIWLVSITPTMKKDFRSLVRRCPYCSEEIQKNAIFCRHCKKDLK